MSRGVTDHTTTTARAWAISRGDGLVLGFTDHDAALEFDGIRFRPDCGLSARAVVQGTGLSIDNTEAAGALSDEAITEADIAAGRWDGADLRLWEINWADLSARRLIFRGTLGEVTRADGAFRAELRGLAEALATPMGRVFHPRCSARLGDGACRVDLSAPGYRADAEVAAVEGAVLHLAGVAGFDQGWFESGAVAVLSGAAQGLSAAVKADQEGADGLRRVELWATPAAAIAVGDRLRLTAGCDKTGESCRLKFLNYPNFRGFPHLPPEDWLIAPAAVGGRG